MVGAFVGLNLLPLTMAVLGFFTTPFNAVLAATFSDAGAHYAGYMHIVQAAGAHSMNFDDPASAEGSGGLSPFIFQRVTGNRLAPPRNHAYNQMSQRGVPFVVWGLIPIDYAQNPLLREAVQSQSYEQGEEPTVLIVVAGKPGGWTHQDTNVLLNHGVSDACATDGSGSCLMGSPGNLVMEPWWYTDKVQRYGFKMVPRAP